MSDRSREAELSGLRNGSRRVGSIQSDDVTGDAGASGHPDLPLANWQFFCFHHRVKDGGVHAVIVGLAQPVARGTEGANRAACRLAWMEADLNCESGSRVAPDASELDCASASGAANRGKGQFRPLA